MDLTAEKILKNCKSLVSTRGDFDSLYETLQRFFFVDGDSITSTKNKGQERHHLLDSTSLTAGNVLAAGLSNFLTPATSKWVQLEHPNPMLRNIKSVQQWCNDATDEVLLTLSRSNFYNQMPIFYKSSGIYGTAGMFCERDKDDGVRFYNIPIKKLYLTEDARERPNEFYLKFEYTAEQAISRFGSRVPQHIKDQYASGVNEDKKFNFLCYLGKRNQRNEESNDKMNKPVRMVWIEESTGTELKEDGFNSMPAVAHRFYKQPQIVYGYSPAMEAIPYVRVVNTIADTMLRASMKQADPAWALPDDAFLGTPNFNPRQINYYQRGKMSPRDEIIPLSGSGNINIGLNELQFYQQQIKDIMFVNTFQAFNDLTKQMTVPEVMERVNEKMTVLGPAVGRYMNDVLQPMLEKVVAILFEDGRLPPLPDEMLEDPSFEVKFVGKLVQVQRQSEVNNIVNAFGIAGQIASMKPEALDLINADRAVQEVFDISNINPEILNSDIEVKQMREARANAQAQMEQMAMAQGEADTYKTLSEGNKNEIQSSK